MPPSTPHDALKPDPSNRRAGALMLQLLGLVLVTAGVLSFPGSPVLGTVIFAIGGTFAVLGYERR
ncbi:hypothetical protein [Georgenia ruanii]|uniref:hypothetical protein n=1 Tax=Georgenia ruanii TaxID=348442 RepID=UPI0012642613|nr:hypothetical protein [Georgenia ruanii]